MIKNHVYNLMMQMVQENQSLWRIKEMYKEQSDCQDCRQFWGRLERQKEENVRELQRLIQEHQEKESEIPIPT